MAIKKKAKHVQRAKVKVQNVSVEEQIAALQAQIAELEGGAVSPKPVVTPAAPAAIPGEDRPPETRNRN